MKLKYTIKDDKYAVVGDEKNIYKVYKVEKSNLGALEKVLDRYLSLLASEQDLKYAEAYINQMFFSEGTTLIDGALINSAIQLLVKCFTNPSGKGRSKLDEKKVFDTFAKNTRGKSYMNLYTEFYNIRRRSLAHDDSDFKDNIVGITMNTHECKAVELTYIKVRPKFLYKENAEKLKEMITLALEFIKEQKEKIENKLITYYNAQPLDKISQYQLLDCTDIQLSNSW